MDKEQYINYLQYSIRFFPETGSFDCAYAGKGIFLKNVRFELIKPDGKIVVLQYGSCKVQAKGDSRDPSCSVLLTVSCQGEADAVLQLKVSRDGVTMQVDCQEGVTPRFFGDLQWGTDSFAACSNREGQELRAAVGPAVSPTDDMLFDRQTDSTVCISDAETLRLSYSWARGTYTFESFGCQLKATVQEHVYEQLFKIPYRPVNKKHTFPTPPVGWMTWYAVKFDACEAAVLENAAWMKENLGDFGADTVWVDWEWYHSTFNAKGPEGIDFFHPDPIRYPHGLEYIAEKIKEMELVPALWIGPTNEPIADDFMQSHPEAILAKETSWCGDYFFDVSNDDYVNEFIPAVADQVKDWGYTALKWDCLPITLHFADQYHHRMCHPEWTSEQALRRVICKVREKLGNEFYMLSCSGEYDRAVLFAMDLFDGARIGGDIFNWQEYNCNFIQRIMRFYAFHNVQIYCDPDNLVIRPEFNTMDQAISRASLVAVLGLPITMGDYLPNLPAERVEILKRCIPALDAHPMDIRETISDGRTVIANLTISKPFEQWNVVDILNLQEEEQRVTIDFCKDLHLEKGKYLVYDFWNRQFLGVLEGSVTVELRACSSCVLSIHAFRNIPQVVSTSRHISQGGIDLQSVRYEEHCLKGVSLVVKGDLYEIRAYDPIKQILVTKTILPEKTGGITWIMDF